MIETTDGTLRVSASFGLKKNEGNYQSSDAHFSFSYEQAVGDSESLDDLVAAAQDLAKALEDGVKLQAFAALDVSFREVDGTLLPVFEVADVPTAAPKAKGRPASGNAPRSAPRAPQTTTRDTITVDFGLGTAEYLDNRPKKASGEFKPGAADFRSVEKIRNGGYHSVWIAQKGGKLNEDVVAVLEAAGIE